MHHVCCMLYYHFAALCIEVKLYFSNHFTHCVTHALHGVSDGFVYGGSLGLVTNLWQIRDKEIAFALHLISGQKPCVCLID